MTNRTRRSQAQWQHLIEQHYRTTNSSWFKRRRILQATETVPSILLSLSEHCVKDYLCGYQGYFQVDGYAGDDKTDAILVGCFAPARRKFIEAQKIQLKGQRSKVKPVKRIGPLTIFKNGIGSIRQSSATQIRRRQSHRVQPATMTVFVTSTCNEYGHLNIGNNRAERAIKPFAIGRENGMFANTA
ncbi:MAG: IS66 family transposase, partial [Candidatus Azotimanducaceae bacterium WSBS_2022_MAG_OTU7]